MKTIVRFLAALLFIFTVPAIANAQLGTRANALKLLEQARQQTADEEKTEETTASSSVAEEEERIHVTLSAFDVDYSVAEQTDWTYASYAQDIMADYAYWLNRLKKSVMKGTPSELDYEAAVRVNFGKPDFEYFDIQYCRYDGVPQFTMEQWQLEAKQLLKAVNEIEAVGLPESPDYSGDDKATKNRKLSQYMCEKAGAYIKRANASTNQKTKEFNFSRAYNALNTGIDMKWISGDEDAFQTVSASLQQLYSELPEDVRENYPASYSVSDIKAFREKQKASGGTSKDKERFQMKKAAMVKLYKYAAQNNDTAPMISGNVAWLSQAVAEKCPEWGKVVASSIDTDYEVTVNALGVPVFRTHTSSVVCEDQGYKVLHYVYLKEDYAGGKYGATEIRPGGLKWNDKCRMVK